MEWDLGVGRCKLLSLEWMNNKVLPLSTRNYSISCDKRQWRRTVSNTDVYTRITESLGRTAETGTTL